MRDRELIEHRVRLITDTLETGCTGLAVPIEVKTTAVDKPIRITGAAALLCVD